MNDSKYKIPDHQNGQVYLTSHRVCYVDNDDPRKNSLAIDLKDVDRYEFYVPIVSKHILEASEPFILTFYL